MEFSPEERSPAEDSGERVAESSAAVVNSSNAGSELEVKESMTLNRSEEDGVG